MLCHIILAADLQDKLHEVKQQLGAVRERRMTREMELAVTDDDQLKVCHNRSAKLCHF